MFNIHIRISSDVHIYLEVFLIYVHFFFFKFKNFLQYGKLIGHFIA